ncbi:amino acid ABC transporter substrate-binding protein [Methanoplanus sp. FWC-SCC4]|uniref:Amino acid ABC transporter substrate-binding protein n=1 Tax=Methanochimaera problematica TaxID=2609417 RepID=A0AA97FCD5_9EURY|nr:ABC transporter substrate-binding protein [Methanoplanus sp. FWC-SCC4]WOF16835.1 amino acid ABC transporter substrate-binding protein [Methanoplanus sp. FWC-SCC4]
MNNKFSGVLIILLAVMAVAFAGCTGSQPVDNTAGETAGSEQGAVEKTTYIIGIDGEYPPYASIDKEGKVTGFDVESAKWVAENQGFEVEFQPLAWDGIIPALLAGKIDMVYSGMTITPDRLEKVNFTTPYLKVDQGVAFHNDSDLTLDDFKAGKAVVGAQRGTTGSIWVEKNLIETELITEDQLKYYDNFPSVITDLQNKRIDAAIYDVPSLAAAIEEKPIEIRGQIDTGEVYGVAIRKDDTELLEKMNDGINNLMDDPAWQVLLEKYSLVGASPR